MSQENIKKFKETVSKDAELEKKIKNTLMNAEPGDRVNVLKSFSEEIGTPFTAEECRELILQEQSVSDEELEMISGGKIKDLGCITGPHGMRRDWLISGCANTVEIGSWCWSDDACMEFDVKYDHAPCKRCSKCGKGIMYVSDDPHYLKCNRCDHREKNPAAYFG